MHKPLHRGAPAGAAETASQPGTWDQLLNVTQSRLGAASAGERRKLALGKVSPNPDQPRKFFEAAALDELAASIGVHGVLQPILVRPHPVDTGRWQIVAGERRWLAAQQAGLTDIPAVVRELDDRTALELGLIENVLREDITPMEEARALRSLLETTGWSYSQLGERLGKNKAWVDHRVRLLKMPDEVQEALERCVANTEGKPMRVFTPRHAGVVVQIEDAGERATMIEAIFTEGLSVAEADRRRKEPAPVVVKKAVKRPVKKSSAPRVAVAGLAIHAVIQAAQAGDGTADVAALLAAMDADRATLTGQ